ncbi:MAG: anaerobic glycerol-3-phosphate dehydrogenase subunit B [Candidatus Thorarchaeota archaeon]|nr:anaerobic glycerol-3-phosphate dehydrogenase subunit B [Candidatus Thorarchaeota archaeon]
MDLETEVLVIGGGMAGLVAGITAAQAGLDTIVVRKGQGATADSSGAIDIAGYLPGGETPFISPVEGLAAFSSLLPFHPYTTLGHTESGEIAIGRIVDSVRESVEWLKQNLDGTPASLVGTLDSNIGGLSIIGTWKPTCLLQSTMHTDRLANEDEVLLFAGISGMPSFNPSAAAKSFIDLVMDSGIGPRRVVHILIDGLSVSKQTNLSGMEVARFIETDDGMAEFTKVLKKQVDKIDATLVALPPIMGVKNPLSVKEYIERETGVEVFELISFPPSVPGFRLLRSLETALKSAGGKLMVGYDASSFVKDKSNIMTITLDGPRRTIGVKPKSVILATGKFIGGGISGDGEGLEEQLFDLPVVDSERISVNEIRPQKMTKIVSVQSDGHTLFECGLGFDSRFRPTDNRGKTYATNLYAAGSILCGYNYHVEKSGLGVALATGRAVGKYATESTKEVSS